MLEVAAIGPRARDAWRRLRFVVDQARAWSEVEHGGLRSYLAWAAHQGEESSRVAEAVLPETDADAVRVMTIHAAKGLEFPIVILSGMTARAEPAARRPAALAAGRRLRGEAQVVACRPSDFDLVQPVDEQMDDYERRRLLYVAATRARDHLVVSLHRSGNRRHSSNAELLAGAGGVEAPHVDAVRQPARGRARAAVDGRRHPADRPRRMGSRVAAARSASRAALRPERVRTGRHRAGRRLGRRRSRHGQGARDLELPPWSKGRYGTAIGRAVHGVTAGRRPVHRRRPRSRCRRAVPGRGRPRVHRRRRRAGAFRARLRRGEARRRTRTLARVVRRHRPAGRHVLEGFVDLIYREDDGRLVIVDYKTDAIPAAALDSRVTYYAPQLQAYASHPAERRASGSPLPEPGGRSGTRALGNQSHGQYDDHHTRTERSQQPPAVAGQRSPEQRATSGQQQLPAGRRHERGDHEHRAFNGVAVCGATPRTSAAK